MRTVSLSMMLLVTILGIVTLLVFENNPIKLIEKHDTYDTYALYTGSISKFLNQPSQTIDVKINPQTGLYYGWSYKGDSNSIFFTTEKQLWQEATNLDIKNFKLFITARYNYATSNKFN